MIATIQINSTLVGVTTIGLIFALVIVVLWAVMVASDDKNLK